ncbi:hypothetical protein UT300005_05830 [Clostridium sp. CTA-5]
MDLYTIVTNIGKAKITNATVYGTKVNFVKLKVGDGNGNYYEPSETQTDLVHTVWEGNINNVLSGGEENPNWIITQTVIPPTIGGFFIREAGIFDNEDNLLAISKYPESYKPSMEDGSTSDLTIELIFEVSNSDSISLKIDPLVTTASKKDLNDLDEKIKKKIDNINLLLKEVQGKENIIEKDLSNEINRSKSAEKTLTDNLQNEINRSKQKENEIENSLANEKQRAQNVESDIRNIINTNKPKWDDKYTRNEIDNKISQVITDLDWKESVNTFSDIAKTYPKPDDGWTVNVRDNDITYRFDGDKWIDISSNSIPLATHNLDGRMSKQDKIEHDDMVSKKHVHDNKSIIDKITQTLVDAWNSAYDHIGDTVKHITSSERNLWNTVSNKANKTDIPTKLSQFTNDPGFITQKDIDTSQNHIHTNKPILDKIKQETLDDIDLLKEQTLKHELMPLETDSTLTKLKDCSGGFVRNMQILGKTLQNLVTKTQPATSQYAPMVFSDLLRPNTKYTIVVYNESDTEYKYYFNENNFTSSTPSTFKKGLNVVVNTTKNTINENIVLKNYIGGNSTFTLKDLMILEGDWTGKETPPYFEGIKSVGEAEGNKISILSKSKNLASSIIDNKIVNDQNGNLENNNNCYAVDFIPVKPNMNLVNSHNSVATLTNWFYYDLNKSYLGTKTSVNITTPQNCYYVRTYAGKDNKNINDINIQIEENTIATQYVSGEGDKTTILLKEPLGGLPDGTCDIVDVEKSEKTKNVTKEIIDGSNEITLHSIKNNTIIFRCSTTQDVKYKYGNIANIISDKFYYTNFNIVYDSKDGIECISPHVDLVQKIVYISISKSKLSSPDLAGFKAWLQANPVTIYYQLAEPKIEKLDIKDTLQAFENGYIQLDNAITPFAHLEYSTNLPSAINKCVEVTDKIVDEVANVESTITDMDAEIDEARKGKTTINERLEDDKKEILNIINQLSNPNLLINGDFQIWQRDISFDIENNKYTADRWKSYFYSNISKSEHGLMLKGNKIDGSCGIEQILESYKFLLGKKVTLSIKAKVSKKVMVWIGDTHTSIELEPNNNYQVYAKTFDIPSTLDKFRVIIQNHSSVLSVGTEFIDIEYVKLELGSVATSFIPRPYGEELALCQRYYQKIVCLGTPFRDNNDNLALFSTFPIPMRSNPTCKLTNGTLYDIEKQGEPTIFTLKNVNAQNYFIGNITSNETSLIVGHHYQTHLELDSEIY